MIVVFPIYRPDQPFPDAAAELARTGASVILCGNAVDVRKIPESYEKICLLSYPEGRGKGPTGPFLRKIYGEWRRNWPRLPTL